MQQSEQENVAISALQLLCKTKTISAQDMPPNACTKIITTQDTLEITDSRNTCTKIICLHIFACFVTSVIVLCSGWILYEASFLSLSYLFPYVYHILIGDEKGVNCKVWGNSPLEQIQCTWTSYLNGFFYSSFNAEMATFSCSDCCI